MKVTFFVDYSRENFVMAVIDPDASLKHGFFKFDRVKSLPVKPKNLRAKAVASKLVHSSSYWWCGTEMRKFLSSSSNVCVIVLCCFPKLIHDNLRARNNHLNDNGHCRTSDRGPRGNLRTCKMVSFEKHENVCDGVTTKNGITSRRWKNSLAFLITERN